MKKIITLSLLMFAFVSGGFVVSENHSVTPMKAEAAAVKQVEALHILVPTEQEAIEIRKEIMTGADTRKEVFDNFTAAAKKYSKCPSGRSGGILGWFGRGEMVPEFEKAAFALPEGTVSEPVKTQFGWHLIYVVSKK